MRGDNAGHSADNTNTAAPTLPAELAPAAAQVRVCVKCHRRFVSDFEEERCGWCIAHAELPTVPRQVSR